LEPTPCGGLFHFDTIETNCPFSSLRHHAPTFPSFWAAISGTIEANKTPHQAAQRELIEETSLTESVKEQGGLYVDVFYVSPCTQKERVIRVYPFVVQISNNILLELWVTKHDRY
jgi:8-oxo-dGTP pyrophosphatase MutT (NUDIX family)